MKKLNLIFKNVIYLTNGTTSLQSIVISEVKEVEYKDNRLSFELLKEGRIINYLSNHQQIADFENFLINYNLQKITNNFEKKVDKLINEKGYIPVTNGNKITLLINKWNGKTYRPKKDLYVVQ